MRSRAAGQLDSHNASGQRPTFEEGVVVDEVERLLLDDELVVLERDEGVSGCARACGCLALL